MMNELTYADVWKTLSAVNVDELKEKKGNLDYLGWSKAWSIIMEHYAFATYEFKPETFLDNGTAMCHCYLRIGNLERYMWLAVMDNKNKSIPNPTTQQIQNTRMRTLVKAISMFGLGFYIYEGAKSFPYSGEDLPDAKKDASERTVVEKLSVNKDDDYLDAWNEPVNAFTFVKTSGEVIHVDTVSKYIKGLNNNLSDPSNVLHKKLYSKNKDNILAVLESTTKGTENHTKLENLISLYEGE